MNGIRNIILSGFFWTIVNQITSVSIGVLISAVLSRLITPAEFGIMGMVTMATGFLNVVKDFGLGAALIQRKVVTDEEYSTVFWVNIIMGAVLSIIVFISAPLLADFFQEPLVKNVTRVMSFTFLINSIGIVWNNRLIKAVAFKQIFFRSTISLVLSGSVGIVLAVNGYGVWALIVQLYVNLIVSTFLNYLKIKWRPLFIIKRRYLRELMRFGIPLLGEQSINYWVRNIDNLLVGKFLGKETLAYYDKAYSLMLLPVRQLSGTLIKVLFPSFSLIQDDKARIANIYLAISRVIAFVSFPVMMCLSILAEPLILILFGDQWIPVIPIFRVLSLLGMFQAIGTLTGNIYLSQGKTKLLFNVGLLTKGLMISGIVIGLSQGGIMGMVYGYCIGGALAFIPDLYFVASILEIKLSTILKNFLPYLLISIVMASVVYLLIEGFSFPSHFVNLIAFGAVGMFLYLFLAWILKVQALSDVLFLVKKNFKI